MTDLSTFYSVCKSILTSYSHYQNNVRLIFAVSEKQYYNFEKYEHSTTESVTVSSHSVVQVSYKDKVYTGYKVQHCTKYSSSS